MAGRGLGSLLTAAIALGCCAPAALADDAQRLVDGQRHAPAKIEALERQRLRRRLSWPVTPRPPSTSTTAPRRAARRGLHDRRGRRRRARLRGAQGRDRGHRRRRGAAAEVAENGLTKAAKAKGAVNVPGQVVIQRAYTFTNYAGRFLYVEARNDLHADTTGPAMSFTYTARTARRRSFNLPTAASARTAATPRSAATSSPTATRAPGSLHVPPRPGRAARRRRDPAGRPTSPCASPTPTATSTPPASTEWANKALPPRVAGFQKDFITKYMDPTEIYTRMDQLTAQYPDIMQVDRPAQQDGRLPASGHGDDGGQPRPATGDAERGAARPLAVYLLSKAMGHHGGNNITAEFKAPAAGTLNAPLSITVTDGTWRTYDPDDADAADGISRDHGRRPRTSWSTWPPTPPAR